jgi:hypothetical protein
LASTAATAAALSGCWKVRAVAFHAAHFCWNSCGVMAG